MNNRRPLPELIALLQQALIDLPADTLVQAAEDAADADDLLAHTMQGTTNPIAERAVASSATGRQNLEDALPHLTTFREALAAYLTDLTGHAPDAPSSVDPVASPGAGGTDRAARRAEPLPDHVRREASKLPYRITDEQSWARGEVPKPTHGIATDDDNGNADIGGLIRSGARGANKGRPGLRKDYPLGTPNHVEAHVAALMRQNRDLRNVSLVLNNRPCGPDQPIRVHATRDIKRGPDGSVQYARYTCDEQLPAILPQGARLTVYVREPGRGLYQWKTYTGTGEAIQP